MAEGECGGSIGAKRAGELAETGPREARRPHSIQGPEGRLIEGSLGGTQRRARCCVITPHAAVLKLGADAS